jgi:hypothetical protein
VAKVTLDSAIRALENAGASMRCKELVKILESLGFDVRDGKKEGHKIATHPGLGNFHSFGFSCGHGNNPEVKRNYVKTALNVLRNHEDDLRQIMESRGK